MTLGIVRICLREQTIADLFKHKAHDRDTLDDIVRRLLAKANEAMPEDKGELGSKPLVYGPDESGTSDNCGDQSPTVETIPTQIRVRPPRPKVAVSPPQPQEIGSKYVITFLDHQVSGENLWWPYAQLIDVLDGIAPDVLEKLSENVERVRRYVSRDRDQIHPGRPDLDIFQTRTGWWISRNIGRNDLLRGLKAMCRAGDLSLGKDVTFWSNKDGYISMDDSSE